MGKTKEEEIASGRDQRGDHRGTRKKRLVAWGMKNMRLAAGGTNNRRLLACQTRKRRSPWGLVAGGMRRRSFPAGRPPLIMPSSVPQEEGT